MRSIDLAGGISASNVVHGLMRIDGKSDDDVRTLVRTAREAGIDMVDHADVYGSDLHGCERRWAEAMQLSPSEGDSWTHQTKAGVRPGGARSDLSHGQPVAAAGGCTA